MYRQGHDPTPPLCQGLPALWWTKARK